MTVSRLTDPEFSGRHLRQVLRQRPAQCEAEHYQEGLVVVHDAGVQLAFEGEHPDVPAALAAHARRMRQRIYRAGDRVYCAVGYALANVIIVRCEGALVVVDTTESHTSAAQVWQDFKLAVPELADWPVAALVYSHNHSDHINGARVFVDEARLQSGQTHIIAHASLMKAVTDNASVVAPILATRSVYSFGALLPSGPQGSVSAGIGPRLINSQVSFLPPTLTFEDQLDITLAGLRFEFRHAPSETDDELVVWLPDEQTLLSAEVIQGECLANVHTIRGTRYRDPVQWVDTLDALRQRSRERGVEGFMLKHRQASYGVGRRKGGAHEGAAWWKWKVAPMTVDAVLVYAQRGHGRRAGVYTDYSFAVWNRTPESDEEVQAVLQAIAQRQAPQPDGLQLVTLTKAYSGLSDAEFAQVDQVIKRSTVDKFGPVRSVVPSLVMELGFEAMAPSPRHRSGLALRFPRMLRIRSDKPLREADTLDALQARVARATLGTD